MRWFPRLLGLAILFGLVGWSLTYSVGELNQINNSRSAVEGATGDNANNIETGVGADSPQYLAFVGGIPSGVYSVADLPDSNDWDYGERGGRTPEAPSISEGNPVNYKVEVGDNDYVTAVDSTADSGDGTDDGEYNDDGGDGVKAESRPSIKPGLYATQFGVENCEYELRRIMDDNRDHVIGHDNLHQGRILVSINEIEPDSFVATESCGEWSPWSPIVDGLTVAGNGDYWVGDLAVGFWDVPAGCLWEKVVGFRGARLSDVESSGIGPKSMLVDQFTLGIRIRHCNVEPMTLSDKPVPPTLHITDLAAAKEAAHQAPAAVDREITSGAARRLSRRRR